jgi:hypothetical protein
MTDKSDRVTESELIRQCEQFKGRADDCGRLALAALEVLTTRAQPDEDAVERAAWEMARVIAHRHGGNHKPDDWMNDERREEARAALNAAALPVEGVREQIERDMRAPSVTEIANDLRAIVYGDRTVARFVKQDVQKVLAKVEALTTRAQPDEDAVKQFHRAAFEQGFRAGADKFGGGSLPDERMTALMDEEFYFSPAALNVAALPVENGDG